MSRLSDISARFQLIEFSGGIPPLSNIAEFLAPTVNVGAGVGDFKKWGGKHFFSIPNTSRNPGGLATELEPEVTQGTFNCMPRSLDWPVDRGVGIDGVKVLLQDGYYAVTQVAELERQQIALKNALGAAGTGTPVHWNRSIDPVAIVDSYILKLMKAAHCTDVAVLFGTTAWDIFRANPFVKQVCPGGPSFRAHPGLFQGEAEFRPCYAMYDNTGWGLNENLDFALTNQVLIFTRNPQPTRHDASFMKTFRVASEKFEARVYTRQDERVDYVGYDWSEDVQVTNTSGVTMLVVDTM